MRSTQCSNNMEEIVRKLIDYYKFKNINNNRDYINFCCPFHNDNSPSCGINTRTGHWKCFTCANGGNLYSFIYNMEKDKESIDFVLDKINYFNNELDDSKFVETIDNIFNNNIVFDIEDEQIILDEKVIDNYIIEYDYYYKRGILESTCKYFDVRYTNSWPIYNRETNSYSLSKRIVIPVKNKHNELIGFVTRSIDDSEPKYKNSLGLLRTLYNINNVYKNKPDYIIITEGVFDVFKLIEAGFYNSVAILGSELSESQFKLANEITDNIILAFDNDKHGREITNKAIRRFEKFADFYLVNLAKYKDFGSIKDINDIKNIINNKKYYLLERI